MYRSQFRASVEHRSSCNRSEVVKEYICQSTAIVEKGVRGSCSHVGCYVICFFANVYRICPSVRGSRLVVHQAKGRVRRVHSHRLQLWKIKVALRPSRRACRRRVHSLVPHICRSGSKGRKLWKANCANARCVHKGLGEGVVAHRALQRRKGHILHCLVPIEGLVKGVAIRDCGQGWKIDAGQCRVRVGALVERPQKAVRLCNRRELWKIDVSEVRLRKGIVEGICSSYA